jgi:hypothetical protein
MSQYKNVYTSLSYLREKYANSFELVSLLSVTPRLYFLDGFFMGSNCFSLNHLPFDEGPSVLLTDLVL